MGLREQVHLNDLRSCLIPPHIQTSDVPVAGVARYVHASDGGKCLPKARMPCSQRNL